MKKVEAIIYSMTVKERRRPKIINGSRRRRIADGSGTTVTKTSSPNPGAYSGSVASVPTPLAESAPPSRGSASCTSTQGARSLKKMCIWGWRSMGPARLASLPSTTEIMVSVWPLKPVGKSYETQLVSRSQAGPG